MSYSGSLWGQNTTYQENVDCLDRVLRDDELVAQLDATTLGREAAVVRDLQERGSSLQRAPALRSR